MRGFSFFAALLLTLFLTGCERTIDTAAAPIKWDRQTCERCRMIISDRKHAAQVVNPQDGKHYFFDDIGCTVLWFDEQKIPWVNEAIVYVTDYDTGEWIDAKTAFWSTERVTSMSYGVVAHKTREAIDLAEDPYRKIIDYGEVQKRVREAGR